MFSLVAYEVIWIIVIFRFMLSTERKLLQEIICRICRTSPLSECLIEIAGVVLLFFLFYVFIFLTTLLEYNCFTMVCFCCITK